MGDAGEVLFSSVDPASLSNPESYAQNGPSFQIGNVSDLSYLSDLVRRPEGGYYALQGFGFSQGEVDFADSRLMIIDPQAGTNTPVALSDPLHAPSSLARVTNGFGGAKLLITELGIESDSSATLLGADSDGNVTVLIDDLGIDQPVDLHVAPSDFGSFASKAFVLDVGISVDGTVENGTGSILAVDAGTQAISVFADMLNGPTSMAFGNGSLLDDPEGTYLYVLEQGDQDPTTGILAGNGSLAAFDAFGNRTEIASSIADASGLTGDGERGDLFFSDGSSVFMVTPAPEPGGQLLLASGVLLLSLLRPASGRRSAANSTGF